MSYCRFENTQKNLRDCAEHIFDSLSSDEHEARKMLVKLCYEIVKDAENGNIPEEAEE